MKLNDIEAVFFDAACLFAYFLFITSGYYFLFIIYNSYRNIDLLYTYCQFDLIAVSQQEKTWYRYV